MLDLLDEQAEQLVELAPSLAAALVVFAAFVAAGWVIGRIIKAAVMRRGDRVHASFLGKLPIGLFAFVGLMVSVDYLGLESIANGLLAGGGVTAIIVGFAFREVGENFLAGLFLAFSRPFRLGDLVQSGDRPEGTVMAVDLRNTHLRTADGRDIFIPNARVFNDPLTNLTRDGLRRPTFRMGIDYRAPIGEVRSVLCDAIAEVPGVLEQPSPRVEIVDFPASFAVLEIQTWINTFSGSDFATVQSNVMDACRKAILSKGWRLSTDVSTVVELTESKPSGDRP